MVRVAQQAILDTARWRLCSCLDHAVRRDGSRGVARMARRRVASIEAADNRRSGPTHVGLCVVPGLFRPSTDHVGPRRHCRALAVDRDGDSRVCPRAASCGVAVGAVPRLGQLRNRSQRRHRVDELTRRIGRRWSVRSETTRTRVFQSKDLMFSQDSAGRVGVGSCSAAPFGSTKRRASEHRDAADLLTCEALSTTQEKFAFTVFEWALRSSAYRTRSVPTTAYRSPHRRPCIA